MKPPHIQQKKDRNCSCGEQHISDMVIHRYNGLPCYLKPHSTPTQQNRKYTSVCPCKLHDKVFCTECDEFLAPTQPELGHCESCNQMTNHLNGVCQKCKQPEWMKGLKKEYYQWFKNQPNDGIGPVENFNWFSTTIQKEIERERESIVEKCEKSYKELTPLSEYSETVDRYRTGWNDGVTSIQEFIKNKR